MTTAHGAQPKAGSPAGGLLGAQNLPARETLGMEEGLSLRPLMTAAHLAGRVVTTRVSTHRQ